MYSVLCIRGGLAGWAIWANSRRTGYTTGRLREIEGAWFKNFPLSLHVSLQDLSSLYVKEFATELYRFPYLPKSTKNFRYITVRYHLNLGFVCNFCTGAEGVTDRLRLHCSGAEVVPDSVTVYTVPVALLIKSHYCYCALLKSKIHITFPDNQIFDCSLVLYPSILPVSSSCFELYKIKKESTAGIENVKGLFKHFAEHCGEAVGHVL